MSEFDVLRERIDALKDRTDLKFSSMETALKLAQRSLDARLEGMNEVREQLREQGIKFVNADVYSERHEGLEKRIRLLETSSARLMGIGVIAIILIQLGAAYLK